MDTSYLNSILHTNVDPSQCYFVPNYKSNCIQVIYWNKEEDFKENLGAVYFNKDNKIDKFRTTADKKFWDYCTWEVTD